MSFGQPNPYGQQQGQPGYGYPPQAPQAPQGIPPQGGYAYPQQQMPQAYPGYPGGPGVGGYLGVPMRMPGLMKTARVLLFIIGGFQLIGAALFIVFGAALGSSLDNSRVTTVMSAGVMVAGVFLAVVALVAILLAARLGKGATPVRVFTIIYGALGILGSLGNLVTVFSASSAAHEASGPAMVVGIVPCAIGLTVSGIIFGSMVTGAATAWFKRPRY
ncbi:hypothetical protein MTF65_19570 [Streptomyces sp. APSN-46.1]|uniref:hypothetical protein n=1 Tax=Streptomyces sp. APSN-46.1 TaxID=2929049 RepID=UPI001FB4B694|nr:hypothetical protein [Streptomyces sp. APSN-46.1]MCJ1679500.1 hypothetical protein [Streptomyces sp. APSN-46.1]